MSTRTLPAGHCRLDAIRAHLLEKMGDYEGAIRITAWHKRRAQLASDSWIVDHPEPAS